MKVRTARRSNQSTLKEISTEYSLKDWCWSWNSNTLATWCKEPTHWKRPWCWDRLKAGGEGDDRGWDGCLASPARWTWVWVGSGSWWWTGKPDVLQSMGSQSQTQPSDWTELKAPGVSKILLSFVKLSQCSFFNSLNIYQQPSPKTKVLIAKGNI